MNKACSRRFDREHFASQGTLAAQKSVLGCFVVTPFPFGEYDVITTNIPSSRKASW